jgi:Fe-S-cluster containining protein
MADQVPLYALNPPQADALAARDDTLRMDLDEGLRFAHLMGDDTRRAVDEAAVTVLALVEELRESGLVPGERYDQLVEAARVQESAKQDERLKLYIYDDNDKYQVECPPIPCGELMHLCRGRCCTLHFPLSPQDLREKVVKWNYLRPYLIRQRDTDGYCVHNDPESHGCGIYHHRPSVCRSYDCRNDKRIWLDYEKRIPAVNPALTPKQEPVPPGLVLVD